MGNTYNSAMSSSQRFGYHEQKDIIGEWVLSTNIGEIV